MKKFLVFLDVATDAPSIEVEADDEFEAKKMVIDRLNNMSQAEMVEYAKKIINWASVCVEGVREKPQKK